MVNSNEILYGTVARFHPIKDHVTLIKSIKKLKNSGLKFKYLLVGKNINKRNKFLSELIKKYHLEDIMILIEEEKNISLVMNAIDLHILSSKSEALPLVVLESMACGTACISTEVGDISKIIHNKNFLVKQGNSTLLFKAIKKYSELDHHEKEEISRKNIIEINEKYSLKKMSKSYINAYYECLNFSTQKLN